MNINISGNQDNNFDPLKQFNGKDKNKDMEEPKKSMIKKSEIITESFVNHDFTTSDKVDSASKIDYHKNSPAHLEDKVEKLDISERNNERRKSKLTVKDQPKSDIGIKMPKYPAHPPNKLDSSYMAVAVGVLVTVIIILIVAIVFILYKNYQFERKTV